ncbi:MAG TPA: phosphoribosylamine--glycine ligase [Candidatus Cloacimonadota bacterium]|nr:phosphoribosylamine--glycine ligase [Candidatus Cloacimonadota bacterium]HPT71777.1 phosphoribosylamine--glycine ligase [Candidatus Cloacimonadota bacterium]
MNVLVIGSGAREHAIADAFSRSKKADKVYVSPGNAGIALHYDILPYSSFENIIRQVEEYQISLIFVGPEQYLAEGIVDFLEKNQIPVIGPSQKAAQLESSKIFAKHVMERSGVPTAAFREFSDLDEALSYANQCNYPQVIKADGLAAGKGVEIVNCPGAAKFCLDEMMNSLKYGNAGKSVIMEEFLNGWEASVFAFCDGKHFKTTIFAQDHKRLLDGDQGPNTGGMGAYAPVDAAETYRNQIDEKIFKPIFEEMSREGTPYRGVLYAGLMMTSQGPKVVEFNCRLGDPETEVILPLLETDIIEICERILQGGIDTLELKWKDQYAVCVVAAAAGYPGKYEKGVEIHNITKFEGDTHLFYAGVSSQDGKLVTSGGRVLCLSALESNMESAISKVYRNLENIHFDRWQFRHDIALKWKSLG